MSSAGGWDRRLLAGAAGLAAGLYYAAWVTRRNAALEPPPVRDPTGAPYPEGTFRFTDGAEVTFIDTGAVAGDDTGARPVVLMIPGADGIKETFRFQIPAFARRHRVVVADLRSSFPRAATFDRLVRDVVELTDALEVGPAVVLGQSLGGAVALRYAARYGERVRALVVSNSLTRVSYEHVGLNRTALAPLAMTTTRYLPTWLARLAAEFWSHRAVWIFDDSPGGQNVVEYALWTGPRTASPRVSSRRVDLLRDEDLRAELADVRVPTLVVKGPRDAYCPPAWSMEIAAGIEGAAYVEIEGTGHCSHVSRPGTFNRSVLDWLRGIGAAGDLAAPAEEARRARAGERGAAGAREGDG